MIDKWKFKDCVFSNCGNPPVEEIECSKLLATCIKAILAKTGRGQIEHLGIGVSRKFPRRANGTPIRRKVAGRWVVTGHWNGNPDGPEAIDWELIRAITPPHYLQFDVQDIYEAAIEVMKEHPDWHMSVVNEPHWNHIEVNYPHLDPEEN